MTCQIGASPLPPPPLLNQGCAKARVFHQKPSPVGLTGLNRVLMGFMG